jgi:hypothetical protein
MGRGGNQIKNNLLYQGQIFPNNEEDKPFVNHCPDYFTTDFSANTAISYMYRDADNYKAAGGVTFAGVITEAGKQLINSYLYEGECIIPEQIGLPALQEFLMSFDSNVDLDQEEDIDHPWHELTGFKISDPSTPATESIDINQFVALFIDFPGWDETLSSFS